MPSPRTPTLSRERLLKKGLPRPQNKDLRHEFDREIRTYVDGPDFLSSLPGREPEVPAAKSVIANKIQRYWVHRVVKTNFAACQGEGTIGYELRLVSHLH